MRRWRWPLLCAALLVAVVAGLGAGPYPLSPGRVARLLLSGPSSADEAAVVVWSLRLPRVLAGLLVGGALSAAGAAFQAMFRNPLVSPDILGVSAGAGLGASLAILAGLSLLLVQGLALLGGLLAVGVVTTVASRVRRHDPVLVLVLSGVAAGTLFSAGTSLVKVLADPGVQLPAITFWLLGGLQSASTADLWRAAPLVLAGLVPIHLLRWRVNLLTLADEEATSLGTNVPRLRRTLIAAATLVTASSVAVAGVVGWVGLLVPHAARLVVGPEFSRLLPASVVLGGAFVVAADTLARAAFPIELPLGVLTAIVGAPAFLWLLARSGRSG